ncbi:MAG: toll/interleukin-1 receptor domain-containing protein, partial [Firmicutes bacterium]|nr:toll/interleukin-1 receptor domain-containing protein [Bacillota bacterium]
MLTSRDDRLLRTLPAKQNQIVMSIRFDSPVPKGVYERIICIFLNACGAIEGTRSPLVFLNIARFFFRRVIVYIIPDGQEFKIIIDEGWRKWITDIRDLALKCIQIMGSFFYDNLFTAKLLLHGGVEQDSISEFGAVQKAILEGDEKVADVHGITSISTHKFNAFFPAQLCPTMPEEKFDCFLAHDWGTESEKFDTHRKVLVIAGRLRANFRVWVDDDSILDNVGKRIVDGMRNSKKVIVFLTQRYLTRVHDISTNASKEFVLATRKGPEALIAVVLDKDLLDPRRWAKSILGYHFGDTLYIDFSSEEKIEENWARLCERIGL